MSNESKKVLVIGGGIAGLTAAWELAGLGAEVALVEKADFLGGHAIQYACKATDECRQCGACAVEKMLKNVVNEPAIAVHLATEVAAINKNGNTSFTSGPICILPIAETTNSRKPTGGVRHTRARNPSHDYIGDDSHLAEAAFELAYNTE